MINKKIVIVEDDRDIRELLRYHLAKEWFSVYPVASGDKALEVIRKEEPALVLLDIMLPGLDGFAICRILKESQDTRDISVIMLTAKGEESEIVKGLQLGADDYIVKPFSPRILMERIRSVLRRGERFGSAALAEVRDFGWLTMHLPKRKIAVNGKPIELTTLEFDIVEFLSRAPGRVFTREQILENAWKEGRCIIDRAVDVHIRSLRVKLGLAADLIETVRGVGYRFKDLED